VPLTAAHTPRLVLGGRDFKGEGQVSPDGRWLAYTHESGGQSVIFVRRYPSGEGRWQISTPQGLEPRWSTDGRRLYYRFDRAIYQVAIDTSSGFAAARPERLVDFVATGVGIHTYTPTSDGGLVTARSPQETAALRVVHLELGFARRLAELTREVR
jgi:Tol biopolymer transport system component